MDFSTADLLGVAVCRSTKSKKTRPGFLPALWSIGSTRSFSFIPACSPAPPNRFVCARQLRTVRKQFNEYDTMKYTLLYMTIVLASYVGLVLFVLADDLVVQRRVAVFCEFAPLR